MKTANASSRRDTRFAFHRRLAAKVAVLFALPQRVG